jgi:hypothetical protein
MDHDCSKCPKKVRVAWRWGDKSGVYETPDSSPSFLHIDEEYGGYSDFWWEEGNGACDCNRASMFLGIEDKPCGNEIEIESIDVIDEPLARNES